MIEIPKIEELLVHKFEHFYPNGESAGFLDEIQSAYFRHYVTLRQIIGCYLIADDVKVNINNVGQITSYEQIGKRYSFQMKQVRDFHNMVDM